MAGPPHHFMSGMNQQQQGMRPQFGNTMQSQMNNPMQNQMQVQMAMMGQMNSAMGNQINNQLANQMGNPIATQMTQVMSNQLTAMNAGGNQMMGAMNQAYGLSNANQMQMQSMGNMQHHNAMQQQQQQQVQVSQQLLQHQQQQQQQHMANNAIQTSTPTPPTQQSQTKELTAASFCRFGQETIQDIVSRTQEVFQTLRAIHPPNGTPQSTKASNEKKIKVQEQLRTIRILFKRLRIIYEKCNESSQIQGIEYTHIESLIPYKDEIEPKHDEKKNSEAYRAACEEMKEVTEQLALKNKQLKDVIDILRRIIWETNTMLTMRRS